MNGFKPSQNYNKWSYKDLYYLKLNFKLSTKIKYSSSALERLDGW